MESRKLIPYLIVLLIILVGMLVYIFIQSRHIDEAARGNGTQSEEKQPDIANGGSIYLKGTNLKGRMIPISGGPAWLLTEGGGCATCHGEDGEGGKAVKDVSSIPPNIKGAVKGTIRGMSEEEFAALVRWGERPNGKELSHEMPRFDVPDDEIVDLMEYIRQI